MNLASYIDHTNLKPSASRTDIHRLCEETAAHGFASACLHPTWVHEMALSHPTITVCTVIGFPLGLQTTKDVEAERAVRSGARELDIVVNPSWVREGEWSRIEEELTSFRRIFSEIGLKLIIESSGLTEPAIIKLTQLCSDARWDWIKTSTGFASSGGATVEAVALMKKHAKNGLRVKASGGIRTHVDAAAMIQAGAERIGTSAGVELLLSIKL